MNPVVSIITPSYNQGEYLEETILSVLNQDYQNIEYIIIDGGSTDNSVDIIKKYDTKVTYWVSEKDKGQADAINKGFAKTTGDYICWINSDDILYPDFISTRIKQFSENPDIDMIYGDVDQGEVPGKTWLRKGGYSDSGLMLKTLKIPVPQQSAVFRRSVLNKTGLLDIHLHYLLDRDFFIRIARNHKILYIPGSHSFFRIHTKSKSVGEALKWVEELPPYYMKLCSEWADYKRSEASVMALCYWECSRICEENGLSEKSIEFVKLAEKKKFLLIFKLRMTQELVKIKHILFKK